MWETLIHLFLLLVLCALCIVGIWTAFHREMILGPVGDWLYERMGPKWSKPFFTCPPCMSSVWGTVFYLCFFDGLRLYPVFILSLCGLLKLLAILVLDKDSLPSTEIPNEEP